MKIVVMIAVLMAASACSDEQGAAPNTAAEETKISEEKPSNTVEGQKAEKTTTSKSGTDVAGDAVAYKLTAQNCVDPDLTKLQKGVQLMLCDGTMAEGSYEILTLPDLTDLVSENIKSGVTVAGVTGSYDNRPADCAANGATGCVATTAYQAADLQMLIASNVKSGVTIAGVTGTYSGATVPGDCTGNAQVGCVSTNTWKSADLTNLTAANVKSGTVIAGVTGTYDNRPADCSSNSQVGCVATSTYKAADLTNLTAGNIKSGVAVAGVTGQFPSSTYKLSGADNTADLTSATLDAKLKSSADFEWFDAEGNRYVASGDADITAANIRSGVTVFGLTGSLAEVASPNAWDVRKGTVVGSTTGLANMQCRQRGGLGAAAEKCYGESYLDITGNSQTCASSPSTCMYRDRISGLLIAKSGGQKTWADADTYCSSLVVDGVSGWRLPERDELMRMFIQGISSTNSLVVDGIIAYWSSTASATGKYVVRIMDTGVTADFSATSSTPGTLCVK